MSTQPKTKSPSTKEMQVSTQTQPLAFEIEVERNTEKAAPAVKHRLEQSGSRKQLTLDEIEQKIQQAEKARLAQIERVSVLNQKYATKKELIRERKNSEERARESKMTKRIAAAQEKREVNIHTIQDKARTHNERVVKALGSLQNKENEQVENRRTQAMQRQQKAAEKREARFAEIKMLAAQSAKLKNESVSPKKQPAKAQEDTTC